MSDRYIQRLRSVREEFHIAQRTLEYAVSHWHQQEIISYFAPRTLAQLQKTLQSLETTYFIRLTAEFEGILKDHLRTNHPEMAFPTRQADWKLDWFLSRVLQHTACQTAGAFPLKEMLH